MIRKIQVVSKYITNFIAFLVIHACLIASGQVYLDYGGGLKNGSFGNYVPEVSDFTEFSVQYQLKPIAELDFNVRETSGLAYINGTLWTHNDSNHENHIYQIDTLTGKLLRTVVIKNAVNHDWEDMAQDDKYLYIGDFGNNSGSRTNLHILKIKIADFLLSENDTVNAEFIHFHYPDQTDFSTRHNNNNYDCEAFFWFNDSLHLFTKNWVDSKTRHYILPAIPGSYSAQYRTTYEVSGLITAADINEFNEVVLLGYDSNWNCFLWLFSDYEDYSFFNGNSRRIELGSSLFNGQTEALVFAKGRYGYITSERVQQQFVNIPPRLYSFNGNDMLSDTLTDFHVLGDHVSKLKIYPNPVTDILYVEIYLPQCNIAHISIVDELQKPVYKNTLSMMHDLKNTFSIPIHTLSSGLYVITIEFCNKLTKHKILIQGK